MTQNTFRLDRHDETEGQPEPIDYRAATRDEHDAELRRLGARPRGEGGVRLGRRNVAEAADRVGWPTGRDTTQRQRRP